MEGRKTQVSVMLSLVSEYCYSLDNGGRILKAFNSLSFSRESAAKWALEEL